MSNFDESPKYEISMLVCSYCPTISKMLLTLKSILLQKGTRFQIIVTDDGSEHTLFREIEDFFLKHNFQDYALVGNDINKGTVFNVFNGLQHCDGEYVKALSPGDTLYGNTALKELYDAALSTRADIIMHDVVCYNMTNGFQIIRTYSHPQRPQVYSVQKKIASQKNYLLLDDIGFGSAFFTYTTLWKQYIEMLIGKVIYAEDHSWRLMVADGMTLSYHPVTATLYEYGTGISTSGSKEWGERLRRDWLNADKIIYKLLETDKRLQNKFFAIMNSKSKQKCMGYKSRLFRILGLPLPVILHRSWCKLFPRYTSTISKDEFIKELFDYQEVL